MMSAQQTSLALFLASTLAAPSSWADGKPVPKPDEAEARLERIADQVAAYEVLRGVFGKEVKGFALDWLARSGYSPTYQFALGIRMSTHFPNVDKEQTKEHARLVKSTIRLAEIDSEQQLRVLGRMMKDENWLALVLKERANWLSNEKNTKNLTALEILYNETLKAADAADLVRNAAQTPKEFLAVRQQLRDVLIKTLHKRPDLQKLVPTSAEASAELLKSRKRVMDLVKEAEKGREQK